MKLVGDYEMIRIQGVLGLQKLLFIFCENINCVRREFFPTNRVLYTNIGERIYGWLRHCVTDRKIDNPK
jgi:hypothetical protein